MTVFSPISLRGFTLIELILVVFLIAVIAAAAVPNFSRTYQQMVLRQTADDLALVMRYAQSRAISKGVLHRLQLDLRGGRYWLTVVGKSGNPGNAKEETIPGRMGTVHQAPSSVQLDNAAVVNAAAAAPKISGGQDGTAGPSSSPADFNSGGAANVDFFPDGTMTKTAFSVCQLERCLIVSTQEQMGYVEILDKTK